jgi:hypothetical protein
MKNKTMNVILHHIKDDDNYVNILNIVSRERERERERERDCFATALLLH